MRIPKTIASETLRPASTTYRITATAGYTASSFGVEPSATAVNRVTHRLNIRRNFSATQGTRICPPPNVICWGDITSSNYWNSVRCCPDESLCGTDGNGAPICVSPEAERGQQEDAMR